jgi:hypothetical protein
MNNYSIPSLNSFNFGLGPDFSASLGTGHLESFNDISGSGIDFGSLDTGALGLGHVLGDGSFQLGNSHLGLGNIDFGDMATGFLGTDAVLGANNMFSPTDMGGGSGININELSSLGGLDNFGSAGTGLLGYDDIFGGGTDLGSVDWGDYGFTPDFSKFMDEYAAGNTVRDIGGYQNFTGVPSDWRIGDTTWGDGTQVHPDSGHPREDYMRSVFGDLDMGDLDAGVLDLDSMDFNGLIPDWLAPMQDLQSPAWDKLDGPTSLFATNGKVGNDIPDADIKAFVDNQSVAGQSATDTLAALKNYGVGTDRIEQLYELGDGSFSSKVKHFLQGSSDAEDFLQGNANVWGNTDLTTGKYYGAGTGYFDGEGKFVTWEGKPYTGLNYKDGGTHEYIDGYYSNTDNNLFSGFINDSKEYVAPVAVIEAFYDMVNTNTELTVNSAGDIFQDNNVLAAFINTAIGTIGGAGVLANPIASTLTGQSIGKWLGDAFHTNGDNLTIAKLTAHADNMSGMELAHSMARLFDGVLRVAGKASPIGIPLPQNAQGGEMRVPLSIDFTLNAGEWIVEWVIEQLNIGNDPFKDVLDSRLTSDQIADFITENKATKTHQSLEDWASAKNIQTVSDGGVEVADSGEGYNWLPDVKVTLDANKRDNNPNYDDQGNAVANFGDYPYAGFDDIINTGSTSLDYGDGAKPWEMEGFDWWRIGDTPTKKQAMIRNDALDAGFKPPPYPSDHRLQDFKGKYGDIISPSAWNDLFTLPSGGDSVPADEWEWPEFSMGGVSAGDALDLLKNAFSQTSTMTPEETTNLGKVLQFSDGMRGPDASIMSIEQERQLMEDSPTYDSWLDKNGGLNQSLLDLNAWNDSMVQKNVAMDNWIGEGGTGYDWFTRAANVSGKDEALDLIAETAEAGWDKTFASFGDIGDAPDMTGATNVNRLLGFLDLESYQPLEQAQQFNQEKFDAIMGHYGTAMESLVDASTEQWSDIINPYNTTMHKWGSDEGEGGKFYNEVASITDINDPRIDELLERTKGWEQKYHDFNNEYISHALNADAYTNVDEGGEFDYDNFNSQLSQLREGRNKLNDMAGKRDHGDGYWTWKQDENGYYLYDENDDNILEWVSQ